MKVTFPVSLAAWLLERLAPPAYSEAVSGDLFEELRSGRSLGWYWRQVLSTVALRLFTIFRSYAWPLAFSIAWSLLYPAWRLVIGRSDLTRLLFDRWSTLNWPYSASLAVGSWIFPGLTFVWLGLLMHLTLGRHKFDRHLCLRAIASLSLSLSALLVLTIATSGWLASSADRAVPLGYQLLYLSPFRILLSLPVAVSLFSAIVSLPRPSQKISSLTT